MIVYAMTAVLTVTLLHYVGGFSWYRCGMGMLFSMALFAVLSLIGNTKK